MASLSEFRGQFEGGARPTLYNVSLVYPAGVAGADATTKSAFMCKGAQLPGITVNPIEVPYQGRTVKIAGDRSFQPITLTIINDSDWKVRNAFERWFNLMNQHSENVGSVRPSEYQVDMVIDQLDRKGQVIASYTLVGAFPSDLSPIELGFDQVDTIEEFTVTIEYSFFIRPDQGIV